MWARSAFLPTVARVVPRGAPVTNLIRYLGIVYLYLYPSLTKSPIFETSLRVVAACKYGYINQLQGQSQIIVSLIKGVSHLLHEALLGMRSVLFLTES